MLNRIFIVVFITLLGGMWACTPKTGADMAKTEPAKVVVPGAKSSAPTIPVPSGPDFRKVAPIAGTPPKIQIGKAETFTLDNGLQVIVVENHKLPRVSFQIFVDNDPVLEGDAAGYLDMMGDLLSKGTTNKTKPQIDLAVDFIGASLSASSNGVSGACLSKHSDKLLSIMSDVLLHPVFPEEEFAKSVKRTQSGLAQEKDDANAISGKVAALLNYGKNHPYGESMNEESLTKVNTNQIKEHYKNYFKPNISYFVVVGDVKKAQVEAWAKQYFGAWQRGDVKKHEYADPQAPLKRQVDFVNKPGAVQSVVNITYPVKLLPGTEDVIPVSVMNTVLGGYFNSRVNANLREGHAYTYGARTALATDDLISNFSATASVRNEVTDSSVTEFLKEFSRMRTELVPEKELNLVKSVMTGNFASSLEKPETVAKFALNTARFKLPADYYEKYLERIAAVTPQQVLAMAQKYVRPDNAHLVIVGNKSEVADKLKNFSPEGKVNMYDNNGKPLEESNFQIGSGVTAASIIATYIDAIGGATNLNKIKDLTLIGNVTGAGPEFATKNVQKRGGKFLNEMSMNGAVMMVQITDGVKGKSDGMGGSQMLSGEELDDLLIQAMLFKELDYAKMGFKTELKGVEVINGKNAYIVEVTTPRGKKTTDYYDTETGLKVREVMTSVSGQDMQIITIDQLEYKTYEGVQLPVKQSVSGVFPVPLMTTFTEVKVNTGVADSLFEIK